MARPSFVLTHRPPAGPSADDLTFLSGDIGAAVATAKAAAADKDLVVLGANVAGQCLARGLVDEIFVFVLPVLLGSGTPLYEASEAERRGPGRPAAGEQHALRLGHRTSI